MLDGVTRRDMMGLAAKAAVTVATVGGPVFSSIFAGCMWDGFEPAGEPLRGDERYMTWWEVVEEEYGTISYVELRQKGEMPGGPRLTEINRLDRGPGELVFTIDGEQFDEKGLHRIYAGRLNELQMHWRPNQNGEPPRDQRMPESEIRIMNEIRQRQAEAGR